jgi:hypothetical protein
MAQPVSDLGSGGFTPDPPSVMLPPNVFSDVLNVRFDDSSVSTTTGEILSRTVAIIPDYGIHWRRPDQGYNIFAKDGNIVRVNAAGGVSTMFTGGAPYVGADWQGCTFNGGFAIILNDGVNTPLYCLYGDPSAGSSFQPLPNWNYIGGLTVTAKVIRSLNYSLVAANLKLVSGGVTTYAPGTIRVSVQAATGSIPTVWQPGLTTDTADEFEISSTSPVLDMLTLRGNMFVYSSDSISMLSIAGTTRVAPYSNTYGILNTDCVVEYDGNHFVVDRNDIYAHNGSGQITSLAEGRVKKWFFRNLNQAAINKVVVVKNPQYKEIWICFPMGSSTSNNMALVFNFASKTWTKRTLGNTTYVFNGPANVSNAWQYGKERLYMTTTGTQTLQTDDVYTMWDGTALAGYSSYVERLKLNVGDPSHNMVISSLYPLFDRVPSTAAITIRVIGQNNYTKDYDLSVDNGGLEDTFTIYPTAENNQSYKVDPRVSGRLINYRITSTDYWRIPTLYIDAKPTARR